jgi:gamma-glutamylcyclotransferase (GGCT)/AIG2-like uncharacterized protein YtfP
VSTLFAYGTLLFPEVFLAVTGRREASSSAATLRGFVRRRVVGEIFPAIVEAEERDRVIGVIWSGLDERDLDRLDVFEGDLYQRRRVEVGAPRASDREVWTYVLAAAWRHRLGAEPWDPLAFERDHLVAFVDRLARSLAPRARSAD